MLAVALMLHLVSSLETVKSTCAVMQPSSGVENVIFMLSKHMNDPAMLHLQVGNTMLHLQVG